MNNDEQTQQADDPSGPGWRDVASGEILHVDDMVQRDNGWGRTRSAGTPAGYQRYRRRIEQQRASDSEPEIDHRQCVKALQQIAQLADTGSKAHKERFCPNGEGDGIANGWRVAEAMREVANNVVGGVSLQQQPSDSEPETMEDLRRRLDEYAVLLAEAERSGQQVNAELQQLREQVQTLTRERDRYRNQLEGAMEHSSKGPRNFRERMVLEKYRAFVEAKDDDPLTSAYVQLRATDPKVLGCSEFVVESLHQDVGGGRLSESVRVFLRHYASEEDQESRKESSARTYFHVKTVGDYERLLSLLGIGGNE